MADKIIGLANEASAKAVGDTIRKVAQLGPVIRPIDAAEGASDVVLIPVKLSDGTSGNYDGTEQRFNATTAVWEEALDPLIWETDGSLGRLYEMNQVEDLDGSVVFASYWHDSSEDMVWGFSSPGGVGTGDDTIAFGYWVDNVGKLRFWSGDVIFEENVAQVNEPSGGFSFDDGAYYIEIIANFDSVDPYTVDQTIQTDVAMPAFYSFASGVHTINWPLLEVIDGEPITHWHGDVLDFGLGITQDESTSFVGSIADDGSTGVSFVFDRRNFSHKVGRTLGDSVSGGVDTYELNTAKWTKFEQQTGGGLVLHNNSPGESEKWVEFLWDSTGGKSIDGTAVDEISMAFDIMGHLYAYGDTTQPDSTQPDETVSPSSNARYTNCDGAGSVVVDTSSGAVIRTSGGCWQFDAFTLQDTNDTKTGDYTDCSSCLDALTATQWERCDTSAFLVDLAQTYVPDDFAWICSGGVWVKAYDSGKDSTANPTQPDYLTQCGAIVITEDCTDLIGWPASDGFDGIGCDSAAVDDVNWDMRWTQATSFNFPSYSITSNTLQMTYTDRGTKLEQLTLNKAYSFTITGNFELSLRTNVFNLTPNNQDISGPFINLYATVGSKVYAVGWEQGSSFNGYVYRDGAAWNLYQADTVGGLKDYEISRSGSTISLKIGGVTVFSTSETNNFTSFFISSGNNGGGSGALASFDLWLDDFVLEDAGSDVLIDPEGNACP